MSLAPDPHPFLPSATAESIVDAALRIVGAGPITDLTIEQVTLAAGASASSVYHYFGSRQGLITAVGLRGAR